MAGRGKGMEYDGVIISLNKTYESFDKLRDRFRQYPFMQPDIDSFLISLHDKNRYLPLTMRIPAEHFSKKQKGKRNKL